ncbi:MAG: metalloregulator ArsR/SmtB family transcription factor [Proteobacteria bacterium]|nr:metalloregulator ArsR/SmtB family transcription factor [Pseudomonadota bacterium]
MQPLLTALRAVAEPTRLRLLALSALGELTVGEMVQILGQSQPRVSRHLKLLADAGLLDRFREGSRVYHRLVRDGPGAEVARHLIAMLPEDDQDLALDLERLAAVKAERARAAAAYFRRNAARWNELRSLYVDEREVERVLAGFLPAQGIRDLLDVGTGTGRMLELFGPRVTHAQGIDLSREMLAVARANLERAGLKNCVVRQADMFQLPFRGASFDAVTIHQVLHYVDNPGPVIAEAARVLRPGGRMLVADFAPHDLESLRSEHEHRRLGFGDSEVAGWFAAAHLVTRDVVHLPGDPLTVTVWLAAKPEGTPE